MASIPVEDRPPDPGPFHTHDLPPTPQRDRAIEDIRTMIRNAGKAGIPMLKYNLTFIGVVSTEPVPAERAWISLLSMPTCTLAALPMLRAPLSAELLTEEIE